MFKILTINGAFVGQRITGQQRFATEITAELLKYDRVTLATPGPRTRHKSSLSWIWSQSVLPARTRRSTLLSLTSRAPVLAGRNLVTVHDLFPLTNPEWYSRNYLAVHVPLLRHHLHNADRLVTVSEHVAQQIAEYGRSASDIIVAPNAPSDIFGKDLDNRPSDDQHSALGRVRRLGTDGYFLAVGSADPRKNFRRLADAHTALPISVRKAYPLVIVGGSDRQFRDEERIEANEAIRTGYVSDQELASLYRWATAVVFPSLDEGFGLPLVEAALAGARLVISDIAVFRWVAGHDVDYFDPLDIESISNAMAAVIRQVSVDHRVERLRLSVRARFSWSRSAAAIRDGALGLESR